MGYQPTLSKEILKKIKDGDFNINVEEARSTYNRHMFLSFLQIKN